MTDAPHPPIKAVKPERRQTAAHKKPVSKGKPIGHESGRARHGLKPHVDGEPSKI